MTEQNSNTSSDTPEHQSEETLSEASGTSEQAHFVLKIKFWQEDVDLAGLMMLTGDTVQAELLDVRLVLNRLARNYDIRVPWQELRNSMDAIADQSEDICKLNEKIRGLKLYFEKKYPRSKVAKVSRIIMTAGDDMLRDVLLKSIIVEDIDTFTGNKEEVHTEVACEVVYYRSRIAESASDKNEPFKPEGVILETEPLIDPNMGRKASAVKAGDMLSVRIIDTSVLGRHVARSFAISDESDMIQAKTLFAVTRETRKHREASEISCIWVQFDEGINGYFEIRSEVRLKLWEDSAAISQSESKDDPATAETENAEVEESGPENAASMNELENEKRTPVDIHVDVAMIFMLAAILGLVLGYIVMQTM